MVQKNFHIWSSKDIICSCVVGERVKSIKQCCPWEQVGVSLTQRGQHWSAGGRYRLLKSIGNVRTAKAFKSTRTWQSVVPFIGRKRPLRQPVYSSRRRQFASGVVYLQMLLCIEVCKFASVLNFRVAL